MKFGNAIEVGHGRVWMSVLVWGHKSDLEPEEECGEMMSRKTARIE